MTNDGEWTPEADEPSLFGALCEGDAEMAGKLLRDRKALSKEEIELLADLLLGVAELRTICSGRLVFRRWRGRPTDRLEKRAKSQARASAIDRLAKANVKIDAALEEVGVKTGFRRSTLKNDRRRYKQGPRK
jgi:hypothetical protein